MENLPSNIYFCRHAQSTGNVLGLDDNSLVAVPNHSFEITELGVKQAEEARNFLESEDLLKHEEYYVTTFLRTLQTFRILFEDTVPFEDPRTDEWWKGIFHSLSEDQIRVHYPVERQILDREGWYHYRPPQGESGKDVEIRVLAFLASLSPVPSVFICGHGRWFLFLERILCNLARDEMGTKVPANCSVVRFSKNSGGFTKTLLFRPSC